MQQRAIGDRMVSAIGLGAMPLSIEGRPEDEGQAVAVIHAALDAGVTLIDTADAYHREADEVGHNELLIAKALREYGDHDVLVATKGGHLRPGDGSWTQDGSPQHLLEAARASAERLGGPIGLYYYHRPDPQVPYADSIGALVQLLEEGTILRAGISNANVDQIDEAREILDGRLAAVQNQFSPAFRSSLGELEHCESLGIAFLPWSPLGGIGSAADLGSEHRAFARIADAHGVSPQQVALAWELQLGTGVIPIPGASRVASIEDSVKAVDLILSDDELAELGQS